MKRVAKATKHRSKSSRSGKEGKGKGGYVTPPVKPSARSVSSGSTTKPRKLSFGQNSVHEIDAENEPGKKGFKEDVRHEEFKSRSNHPEYEEGASGVAKQRNVNGLK